MKALNPKKIVASLLLVLFLAPACSTTSRPIVATKKPPMYKRPDKAESNLSHSPAKKIVVNGIKNFKDEKFDNAEWQFEEAINLDPDYGPAYYWLARTRFKFDKVQKALVLLEKAESLLDSSQTWLRRIDSFREFLLEKL